MGIRKLWQRIGLAAAGVLAFEAAARIVAPGLNTEVINAYLRNGGSTWLLNLYDRLGGGALSRGGILALGFMPYFSARIFMRLARVVSPRLEELANTSLGHRVLRRWTRALTVGLSLIQSYGFTQFLQSVPDAVADPGLGFVVRTMAILTSGSIVAMALAEQIERLTVGDSDSEVPTEDAIVLSDGEVPMLAAPSSPLRQETDVKEPERVRL